MKAALIRHYREAVRIEDLPRPVPDPGDLLVQVRAASVNPVDLKIRDGKVKALQKGHRVLIHAGSGGVGTFAIQLAKHLGAWVATTVGARNVELVKRLGADEVIDYRTARFDEVLKGIDFVLDTQGGETLWRSFSV